MGTLSAALTMALYLAVLVRAGWHPGAAVGPGTPLHDAYRQATTITFAGIVACQIGTAFAARTERASLRSIGLLSNKLLIAAIGGEIAFAAALIYVPALQPVFGTAPPPAWAVALLPVCSAVVWTADELYRLLRRSVRSRPLSGGRTPSHGRSSAVVAPDEPVHPEMPR
jgi:magnesium-transporting ATPase (P-type)